MHQRHVKRICICEEDTLPVIIKINPCPGKTCPYARESIPLLISQESSISVISFDTEEEESEELKPSISEKADSSTSTSEGKRSTATEIFEDYRVVSCENFKSEGKCVNDAQCTTTKSLYDIHNHPSKIVAHKANQVICTHTNITLEEQQKNLEESIMRGQSQLMKRGSLESTNEEIKANQTSSRLSMRF